MARLSKAQRISLGVAALILFTVHAVVHVLRGTPEELMWACSVSALLIALGCLGDARLLVSVGVLWLSFGTPMWALDLLLGSALVLSSLLTHLVSPLIGIAALRHMGWPRSSWPFAAIAAVGLMGLTRLFTSPKHNINMAFRVWEGWEAYFASYPLYFVVLVFSATLVFFLTERMLRTTMAS